MGVQLRKVKHGNHASIVCYLPQQNDANFFSILPRYVSPNGKNVPVGTIVT